MIRGRIARFHRLSREQKQRALRAMAVMGAVEIALRLAPFHAILRILRWRAGVASGTDSDVATISRWVEAADRVVPGRASCLRRSLTAYWFLGHVPGFELRISARPDSRGRLEGHAWVRVGNQDVIPPGEHKRFRPLLVIR